MHPESQKRLQSTEPLRSGVFGSPACASPLASPCALSPASRSLARLLGALLVFLVLGCGVTGCNHEKTEDVDAKTPTAAVTGNRVIKLSMEERTRMDLKTENVETREVAVPLHMTGRIEPDVHKEVDVHSRIAGRITEIFVKPGQPVTKGQVLALLDSAEISDLESELLESRSKAKIADLQVERERSIYEEFLRRPSALIRARAVFNEAKVGLELAETEHNRIKGLFEEKIAATKDYVASQARLAQEKTGFEEAQANLQREEHLYNNRALLKRDLLLAQAEAERVRNHNNTLTQRLHFLGVDPKMLESVLATGKIHGEIKLLAAISGIVSFGEIALGEVAQPSVTLFTISDISTVQLQVDLPEVDLPKINFGDRVKIRIPSYPDETFEGTISYIGVNVSADTRTVPTRARLNNPKGQLKKGMFAEIEMEGSPRMVLACPKDALQENHGKQVVFVQTNDGFEERPVKTGVENERYVEVISGLNNGDKVATQGSLMLKNEITFNHGG